MPVIDPKKGFAVSADAARALIAKGAGDARPKQDSGALKATTKEPVAVAAPSNPVVADYRTVFYPNSRAPVTSVPTVCPSISGR